MPRKNPSKVAPLKVKVITPTTISVLNRQLLYVTSGMLVASFAMASLLTYVSMQ